MFTIAPVDHLQQIDLRRREALRELRRRFRQRLETVGYRLRGSRADDEPETGGDESNSRKSMALPAADPEPVLSNMHQTSVARTG